jgi:hypothetical protein
VDSDGTLVRQHNVTSVTHASTGRYRVDVATDITNCAYVASVGDIGVESGNGGFARTGLWNSSLNNAIGVETFFKEAAQQDFPFHLQIVC